ncbi:sterol desaturase family protein [Rhodanobacter sp. 7MK24]|uniref:sterol desaturase family protein n=1 Tax=Rhodanobacter sp. 7MK24 TaxID=2775922 RepID=UPI0017832163|nr:sterol desaturase family protein [Rhodanobacter sp. 7MK24]MBD8879231.1 sterol desaturase family protein [Rhodanobacter sp. 7MK24]
MHAISDLWAAAVDWLTLHAVKPVLAVLHLAHYVVDSPREIAQYFLLTAIQVAIIACVFRPMESLWPVEQWQDRRATLIDRAYTLLKLFGVLPLFTYLVLSPVTQWIGGAGASDDSAGLLSVQAMVPWLSRHPVPLFLVYYAIYDLVYYGIHRLQHSIPWWWALHSLHHSQRQLNCWSNDRDHYLDDLLEALIVALAALLIGVSPTDYALLVLSGELLQNLGHANVRLRFGPVLEKLLVDPRYHRLHHMRVDPDRPNLHYCNFAFIFPLWDIVFGTALFGEPARPTGVGDPMVDADNRRGIVGQQLYVLRRFWGALRRRAGWRPGDVAFDESYAPISVRDFDLHALEASQVPLVHAGAQPQSSASS